MPSQNDIPYDIPSREMLLALINKDNNTNLPFTAVQFGPPQPQFGELNTKVTIYPRGIGWLSGNKSVNYRRLDIEVFLGENTIISGGPFNNTLDIANAINQQMGLDIREDDIIMEVVYGRIHILKMQPESYAWFGSVRLDLEINNIPLYTVIANPILSGLNF